MSWGPVRSVCGFQGFRQSLRQEPRLDILGVLRRRGRRASDDPDALTLKNSSSPKGNHVCLASRYI